MAAQRVANAQQIAPAGAVGVAITPSAVPWVNSAWVTVVAAMPGAGLLTGLVLGVAGSAAWFEVDVGVGGAGSESVIATFQGNVETGPALCGMGQMVLPIPINALPAGGRVALRLRKVDGSTVPWQFAITYYLTPIVGTLLSTAQPQRCIPTATTPVILPSHPTIVWASGSWVPVMAAAAADLVVVAVFLPRWYNGQNFEVDLATGAVGFETVLTTIRGFDQLGDGPQYTPLPVPLLGILAGQRVIARSRHANPSILNSLYFGFSYHHLPL
jgi:hypothetical protein